jgi:SAM-dependent methyltransferase
MSAADKAGAARVGRIRRPASPNLRKKGIAMSARWHVISSATRTALQEAAAFDGPRIRITEQLGSNVWQQVKFVLEALGAVYVIGTSAFELEADRNAEQVVSDALAAGRVMHDKNRAGFVPTPPGLAEYVVEAYAEVPRRRRGHPARVLEPSAGVGALVEALRAYLGRDPEWTRITAIEQDAQRAAHLPCDEQVTVRHMSFEAFAQQALAAGDRFDLVVMNPPFAVPGNASLWAAHVQLAWRLLAPGGRLVAIVPAAVLAERRSGPVGAARELVRRNGGAERLADDAFAAVGVTVPCAVVWMDRPLVETPSAALPPAGRHPALFRAYTGDEVPIPVDRPYLTRAAAETTPVQSWLDSWRRKRRVFRYRADCAEPTCTQTLWMFDDGENDPRGVLGNHSGCFSITPPEDGAGDARIGLCPSCSSSAANERGLALARRLWAEEAAARRDRQQDARRMNRPTCANPTSTR